ncbi:hypothetical protein Tco_1141019, partial [Tanacetum coccineum]
SQPHTRGSSEGTGIIPWVLDEVKDSSKAKGDSTIDWGSEEESEYSEENKIDEEIEQVSTDEEEEKQDDQDGDDDRSIDIEKTDDEKETDDEFVHGDEYVHRNVDREMKDDEVAITGKDSPSVLNVPILVIPEPTILSPIPEVPSVTPVTTLPPPPSITNVTPVLQQQTTPIPTPPITTTALATTIVPDLLPVIVQRLSTLEKDVQELKQVDHVTLFITDYSILDLATTKTCREESDPKELRKIGGCKGTRDGLQADAEDSMTLSYFVVKNRYSFPCSIQNRRDLPTDIPLDRTEVLRYDTKGVKVRKGIMQIKTELTLEQTQQGVSDNVLSDTYVFTVTMETLSEPTSNKLYGRIDMVIKDLDLEPKIDAMMRGFLEKRIFKNRTKTKPQMTKLSTEWKKDKVKSKPKSVKVRKPTPTKSKVNQMKKIAT